MITKVADDIWIDESDPVLTGMPAMFTIYRRQAIVGGFHPVHQTRTTELFVWMPVGQADNRADAVMKTSRMVEGH